MIELNIEPGATRKDIPFLLDCSKNRPDPLYDIIKASCAKYPWGTIPERKESHLTYETVVSDLRKYINEENDRRYLSALSRVMSPKLIQLCLKKKCARPFETLGIKILVFESRLGIYFPSTKHAILVQDGKIKHEFEVL